MDTAITLIMVAIAWQVIRMRYQRGRIALLGSHLAKLQLERHMETLTQGYTRAIHEKDESRQLQVLDTFAPTERALAAGVETLAGTMQNESAPTRSMGPYSFCLPYAERFIAGTRDFATLLRIHAVGLRHVVDNEAGWDPKTRAFHLSAELYLLQHSCHWFCKSRNVADARLLMRHQINHQKVLDSVSEGTRKAYLTWMRGGSGRNRSGQ
jgi:hypothetical protein